MSDTLALTKTDRAKVVLCVSTGIDENFFPGYLSLDESLVSRFYAVISDSTLTRFLSGGLYADQVLQLTGEIRGDATVISYS